MGTYPRKSAKSNGSVFTKSTFVETLWNITIVNEINCATDTSLVVVTEGLEQCLLALLNQTPVKYHR